jgi:hypothetical protein
MSNFININHQTMINDYPFSNYYYNALIINTLSTPYYYKTYPKYYAHQDQYCQCAQHHEAPFTRDFHPAEKACDVLYSHEPSLQIQVNSTTKGL